MIINGSIGQKLTNEIAPSGGGQNHYFPKGG